MGDVTVPGAPDGGAPARVGRWWTLPLRLALSIAMVWFLLRKIAGAALTDVLPPPGEISLPWMAAAFALTAASIVLAAARWQQVLGAMAMASPAFGRLIAHYFAGQFVSNVLPSTIGGDVLRAARLAGDTGDRPGSLASLVIERLTGWLVLPILTLAGLALSPEVRGSGHPAVVALVIALATISGLAAILFVADHPRLGGRFAQRGAAAAVGVPPAAWRRFLRGVHEGISRLRRHPRATLGVIGAGIVYQLVLVAAAVAAARSLGLQLPAAAVVAIFPVVLMVQVLPIGISGVGLREWSLVLFLSPLGVPHERAIGLGILVFVLNLLVGLLGAPAFLAGGSWRAVARTSEPPPGRSSAQ